MKHDQIHILVPEDSALLLGGYRYDQHMIDGLRAAGMACEVHRLSGDFPWVDPVAATRANAELLDTLPGATVVIDGLLLPTLHEVLGRHADRLRLVALVHHPAALESGLTRDDREDVQRREQRALMCARRVIVTSAHTREVLERSGVPVERVRVAVPGTDSAPLASGSGPDATSTHLLCVAALIPRKGHMGLVEALAQIQDSPWRASFAGSLTRDPDTARRVRERINALGLEKRVALLGEVSAADLRELYDSADLFVQPSLYEGYGMAISEAIARGLPVVSTTAGAIPTTAPPEASRLVEPGDVPALAKTLSALLGDPAERETLAAGARRARQRLLTWPEATARFAAELERP